MGQFLIIGLKLEACVCKDRINKYVDEREFAGTKTVRVISGNYPKYLYVIFQTFYI